METKFQTSFIPKKPIVTTTKVQGGKSVSFSSVIGMLIFVLTLAMAGGVVLWKGIIKKQIEQNKVALGKNQEKFDPALIQTLAVFDKRIKVANTLIDTHIAPSAFFILLQSITLKSVRFTSYQFSYVADKIVVTMKGEADSFASVALQSDVFNEQTALKNTLLTNLTVEQTGKVTFDFSATIDPELVSYKKLPQFAEDESSE